MEESYYNRCDFNPRLKRKIQIIDALFALIIVGLGIASLLSYTFLHEKLGEEIIIYGRVGLFLSILVLEFIPNFLNPYLPLLIAMAAGMGIIWSVVIASIASGIGSFCAFELGKKYGWRFICPLFEEKTIGKIITYWGKYGKWFVALSAITPLPYVPLVFGALDMKRIDFWFYGILVRIISFVCVGSFVWLGFSW